MADILPVPPGGGAAQQEYDRQVVASVQSGDQAGLSRLKGHLVGIPTTAALDPEDPSLAKFAFPAGQAEGVAYWGDGTSDPVPAGVGAAEHAYSGAGTWAAVFLLGATTGVCVLTTGDKPVEGEGGVTRGR